MAKEKEGQEIEQFGQKIPPEPEPEPEVKTPTVEEQLATLQRERDILTKERDEATKGLKTAHSRLTEKDREIRGKNAVNTRIDGLEETIRILAAMQNERLASGELEEGQKTDYLGKFDDIVKKQKTEREQATIRAQQQEYNLKADAVYVRAKEAFRDDEESIEKVEDLLLAGRLERAESKVARAEKTTDTKEKKVESEEERIERLADERLLKKMQEKGMLESETSGPSGASPNDEQIRKNYRENPTNPKAYREYHEYLTRTGQSHK